MKKLLLLLGMVIFGISNFTVNAQGSWFLQTNPTTSAGESMQFVSATEGWISLTTNQLLHTTNAGSTWNSVTPNSSEVTNGMDAPGSRISFVNTTTGWAFKTLGTGNSPLGAVLYKTTNGGTTWNRTVLSSTTGDAAIQVQFVDTNNGWVLIFNMNTGTPTFLKTTNGGASWTTTNGGGIFYYVNATTGYAYTAGPNMLPPYTIYKTTDGGTSWTPQYTDATSGEIKDLQFTDVNNGWAVGANGKFYKTSNGGATWNASIYNSNYDSNKVHFINSNIGWISSHAQGSNPVMIHTTNGGMSWTEQTLPFYSKTFCMDFWDANNGWAASDSYNQNGTDYPGLIARYFYNPAGTYTNATLNGPWLMYADVNPINPYNDNLNYLVFDGNGSIIDMNGFGGPWFGSYTVTGSGVISGNLTNGSESFPIGGLLISTTEGTGSAGGQTWKFHKIANPGALKDKISGTLTTSCSQKNVIINIDNNGQVMSTTGLNGPVTGRVYTDLGVFIGHFITGESTDGWHEFSIYGYYNSATNLLTGQVSVDMNSCNTGTSANLVRSDNLAVNEFENNTKNIVVYPNPNNGSFYFDIKEPKTRLQIQIFDMLGKKVYETINENQQISNQVIFNPVYQGLYFIRVFDGENEYKDKILIQ